MKKILAGIFIVIAFTANAQPSTISKSNFVGAIDKLASVCKQHYIDKEKADKMDELLRKNIKSGKYDTLTQGKKLATLLTNDIKSVYPDKHLKVLYDKNLYLDLKKSEDENDTALARQQEIDFYNSLHPNYGFEKVEIMNGNIGYVDIRAFNPNKEAKEKAAIVMSQLKDANALIVDLRKHVGGSPEMIEFLCSYFFKEKIHLNSFYTRNSDTWEHFYTTPRNEYKWFEGKPIYILTSNFTFSGGEEFAYDMKILKRGTLIGETTGGGANPIRFIPVLDGLVIAVPFGKAVNPITKTNWEAVGVEPDIKMPAKDALEKALELLRK